MIFLGKRRTEHAISRWKLRVYTSVLQLLAIVVEKKAALAEAAVSGGNGSGTSWQAVVMVMLKEAKTNQLTGGCFSWAPSLRWLLLAMIWPSTAAAL